MKQFTTILTGALVLSGALLVTACGKGGGGKKATVTTCDPQTGVCTVSNAVDGGTGSQLTLGEGSWNGRLIVSNINAYRQFLFMNGLCQGPTCNSMANYMGVRVDVNGSLPGGVRFALAPYMQGRIYGRGLRQNADAYGASSGFKVVYNPGFMPRRGFGGRFGGMGMMPPPMNYNANTTHPMLQISVGFANTAKTRLNATVYFNGTKIASGQMLGYLYNYNGQYGGQYGNQFGGNQYGRGFDYQGISYDQGGLQSFSMSDEDFFGSDI